MEPYVFALALANTRRHVLSARPDAPVVRERKTLRVADPTRRAAAGALRRLASHVEPGRPSVQATG